METLLDEADAWIASNEESPPDFAIPEIYMNGNILISQPSSLLSRITTTTTKSSSAVMTSSSSPYIEVRDTTLSSTNTPVSSSSQQQQEQHDKKKGYGWFSKQFIPVGTIIMIAKPISMVMEWEDEDDDDEDDINPKDATKESDHTLASTTTTSQQSMQQHHKMIDDNEMVEEAQHGQEDVDDEKIDEDWEEDDHEEEDEEVEDDVDFDNDDFDEEEDNDISEDHDDNNEIGLDDIDHNDDVAILKIKNAKTNEEEPEPHMNEILLLRIVQRLLNEPNIWIEQLNHLYPRTEYELVQLPSWVCHDDIMFMQIEECYSQLIQRNIYTIDIVRQQIAKRLPLIIRYNILSIETSCELLSYPTNGYIDLAGVGLYHLPSYFNHSQRCPNINRWAVGDVMSFVTNQNIQPNTELCISYIEHDILCENSYRRNQMLRMDFKAIDYDGEHNNNKVAEETNGPDMPVVDSEVQNELMSMNPFDRLSAIDEMILQAIGVEASKIMADGGAETESTMLPSLREHDGTDMLHESEQSMSSMIADPSQNNNNSNGDAVEKSIHCGPSTNVTILWFQCDIHNLRILKAITLDVLGQSMKALLLWESSIQFVENPYMPPMDESSIVIRVQAALCSLHIYYSKQIDEYMIRAKQHANTALKHHTLLFGGNIQSFRRRFYHDFALPLRPLRHSANGDSSLVQQQELYVNTLWPIDDNGLIEL